MFSVWKESLSGTVTYVGKDGINEVKVKGAFVKLVYLFLQECAEGNPSYNDIAEATELSRSIVIRCVKVLEEKGLIGKKLRPTHTEYHKSNVYSIHQQNEQRSRVQHTPRSFKKDLNTRIRLEDDPNFMKINDAWKDCFHEDLNRFQYITLTKIAEVDYLVEQISLIKEYHPNKKSIDDPGKYVFRCIQNGGFQPFEYQPRRGYQKSKTVKKNAVKSKPLPKSVKRQLDIKAGLIEDVPQYTPEEIARKKASIDAKLKLLYGDAPLEEAL